MTIKYEKIKVDGLMFYKGSTKYFDAIGNTSQDCFDRLYEFLGSRLLSAESYEVWPLGGVIS